MTLRRCPIDGCTVPGDHGHGTDARYASRNVDQAGDSIPDAPQARRLPETAPLAAKNYRGMCAVFASDGYPCAREIGHTITDKFVGRTDPEHASVFMARPHPENKE